jgi:hypothetical protein
LPIVARAGDCDTHRRVGEAKGDGRLRQRFNRAPHQETETFDFRQFLFQKIAGKAARPHVITLKSLAVRQSHFP